MNYLLDVKQYLLITSIGSNQQSALDFPLFSFFFIIFYCVSLLYSGTCLISLLSFYPMLRVRAFTPMLCQSIAADCLQTHLMTRFTLQGALMKYRLFLSIATAGVLGSTAFAGTMGPVVPSKDWTWVGSVSAGPVWQEAVRQRLFI